MKKLTLILFLLGLFLSSMAQEGMWLLSQINQLDMKEKGLQISPEEIYSPDKPSLYNAIVQLGGGTASFVSPEGLMLTNHHVAFGALQRASTVTSDYLSYGFLAKNREDEIQATGYRAQLLTEMKDVTNEVLAVAKGITDLVERDQKINEKIREMTRKIEGDREDINAVVAENYNGKQYILYVYKVLRDIRIVYAPPASIGKFGGEIDNWMWPRHTGDFSFLRAYVAPNGDGAEYSPDNVPYKPKVWLKVANEPIKDGDLTFIVGFPGFTTRYRTSNSANWNLKYNYPFTIKNFTEIIEILDETTKNDPEGHLRVAALRSGLSNVLKNNQGKVDGMIKTNYVQQKLDFEQKFTTWINSNPTTKEKYGHILPDIRETYKMLEKTKDRDNVYGVFQGLAGTPLNIAATIYLIARELEKPESERRPGLDENAVQQTIDGLENNYTNYFEPADKAMLAHALRMANELPAGQRLVGLEYIFKDQSKSIDQFVGNAYKTTRLMDIEYAKSLFGKSSKELEALKDPFITMVANLFDIGEESQKTYEIFAAKVTDLRKQYIDALYKWKGEGLYPDANGTMRFTYGNVKGYSPEDAVWYYAHTTLKGVIDKNTGKEPFDVPAGLIDLYKKKDFGKWMDPVLKDVPVAFLHLCDITGGNSGSPVLNARGEIIGVAFDGNYEAMISDWQYYPEMQRTISVDIRYVMFVTEKFGKAGFLLAEMGVAR